MIHINIEQYITKWLDYLSKERGYSHHTVIAYQNDIIEYTDFLESYLATSITLNCLSDVTTRVVRAWLANRRMGNYTPLSTLRSLASVKNFYKFLYLEEGIRNDPIFVIRGPKKPSSIPKALTQEETQKVLNNIAIFATQDWLAKRDIALLFLIYGLGLRISEALSITKNHLRSDFLKVLGKGSKERVIPWINIVKDNIEEYLASVPYILEMDDPIFLGKIGRKLQAPVFRRQLMKLRRSLGLPESVTPHTFRHNFATHLLENGADLKAIGGLLGHKNLSTTQNYTKVNFSYLYAAYSSAHPLGQSKNTNKT